MMLLSASPCFDSSGAEFGGWSIALSATVTTRQSNTRHTILLRLGKHFSDDLVSTVEVIIRCAYHMVLDHSLWISEKLIVGVWFVCQFRDFLNQSNFSFDIEILTVVHPICIFVAGPVVEYGRSKFSSSLVEGTLLFPYIL